MTPLITVIHATKGRPEKAEATMRMWHARAKNPETIEYLFVVNQNDKTSSPLIKLKTPGFDRLAMVIAQVEHSAPAWNVGATASRGMLLVQGQDDVEPPLCWDQELTLRVDLRVNPAEPVFVAVSDGYRKGDHGQLCTTAIMTRAYRDMEGHFLFPGYHSVYSDDEVTYRALRNARDGDAKFVDARDLVFKHQHHYHVKDEKGNALVPWDDTYAAQNSAEAYAQGKRLFEERNPRAATDGLKKW